MVPRTSHGASASAEASADKPRRSSLFSWPDIKLSLRLLIKNPGLTIVSTVGITVGIAITAGMFGFLHANFAPTLPLDEGDRIIALEDWDIAKNNEARQSLHDFVMWRDQMTSVVEISAFRHASTTMLDEERSRCGPRSARAAAVSSRSRSAGGRSAFARPWERLR